ncbi:hypothetical protein SAMN02745164_01780 [Marinitoga hydrogenitolerans DSM 16785]|uniref:Uncharacterized protein n=1 Tax=Marinitoga hydrogenitolerans (strain DSM 16785 / JCM 12826 / AT1271) TaxID=1122195 RepID=A0A1M4YWP2_MARH1|nr:hypothetical protein [Marinitoga hydrogenitolerans]SHF09756.1 hypothetical protein SAMN02745164_01780 [Marinitoga hydrogenitolerans DSM 16785]
MKLINLSGYEVEIKKVKKIVIEEKKKKLIINNKLEKEVVKVHVDSPNSPIEMEKKCDYLFFVNERNLYYYLELKGRDIKKAYEQILNTKRFFKTKKDESIGIIIHSNKPKFSPTIQKLKLNAKREFRELITQQNQYTLDL